MISLQWLEAFVETARHGSISKASRALHLTQPALSRQLKLLQNELGAKLYQRTGHGIELTPQGKMVLENAAPALGQITNLKALLSGENATSAGVFRAGGCYSSAISLLPRLLARFKNSQPEVEIDLQTGNSRTLCQMALDRKIEIGVVTAPAASPFLTVEKFRREKVVLFAHATYRVPLSGNAPIPLILRHPRNASDATAQITRTFESRGLKARVVMRCGSPQAIKEAVRTKAGVGVLFKSTVDAELKRGDFKIVRIPGLTVEGQSFIIYRSDTPLSPLAAKFLDLLRRHKRD